MKNTLIEFYNKNFPRNKEEYLQLWKSLRKPLMYFFGIIFIFFLLTPVFTYFYFANDLVSKEAIMNSNNKGLLLLDRNNQPFFSFYEAKQRIFIPLEEIPKHTQDAIISAEDKDFYTHPGFSLQGIFRSAVRNIEEEKLAYGGSTITQQLVKNALLTSQKNFFRKYQEVVLASEIERRYTKPEILEMYLNSVYFGEGALGIENAAHIYFGKSAKNLSIAESALLTGILPAPSAFSPLTGDKEEAFERQKIVLSKMQEQGYITPQQKSEAEKQQIIFTSEKETNLSVTAPHFALMVKDQLKDMYDEETLARSGFQVKTTLNIDWQEYAENTVKNQLTYLRFNKASNAALVAMNPKNGEIYALVGSYDWYDESFGKYNIVTAKRQPGSAFKPLMYAKAFSDEEITPATVLKDEPTTFPGGYKPKNYDNSFRGPVLPRRALANSLNVPAVEIMEKVGIADGLDFARSMGITTLRDATYYGSQGYALVLGGAEVPLLELTTAYGVFANEGTKTEPTTILEIKDKRGNIIYSHSPKTQEVLDPRVAFIISSILSDNSARTEVFGNALSISRPAAVKTGTTENYRDALTVGYTPSLVIGVWVGNNDNTAMNNIAGSLGAAPIWRRLMEYFLKDTPVEHFSPPSGLDLIRICRNNGGKSYNTATSSAYLEYFLMGSGPTRNCDSPTVMTPTITPTPTPGDGQNPTETPTPTPNEPTQTPTPTPDDDDDDNNNGNGNGNGNGNNNGNSIEVTIPQP